MTLARIIAAIMLVGAAVGYRIAFADYCRQRRRRARRIAIARAMRDKRRYEFEILRLSVGAEQPEPEIIVLSEDDFKICDEGRNEA